MTHAQSIIDTRTNHGGLLSLELLLGGFGISRNPIYTYSSHCITPSQIARRCACSLTGYARAAFHPPVRCVFPDRPTESGRSRKPKTPPSLPFIPVCYPNGAGADSALGVSCSNILGPHTPDRGLDTSRIWGPYDPPPSHNRNAIVAPHPTLDGRPPPCSVNQIIPPANEPMLTCAPNCAGS